MFDPIKLEGYLRGAADALDDACDELDKAEPEQIAPPGAAYLLAKLHVALMLIESELPEFKKAYVLEAAAAGVIDGTT